MFLNLYCFYREYGLKNEWNLVISYISDECVEMTKSVTAVLAAADAHKMN